MSTFEEVFNAKMESYMNIGYEEEHARLLAEQEAQAQQEKADGFESMDGGGDGET